MSACKSVYVYHGKGSSSSSEKMLYHTLTTSLKGSDYAVQLITPHQIKEGGWHSSAALLALGGGYDLGYIRALGKQGMDSIRSYVHDGGSYLGICAGGYFGCTEIEFDKDGPLEVHGGGRLGFYPGKCVGPVFPGFVYNSEAGACASLIEWHPQESDNSLKKLYCYFNGGGSFIPYHSRWKESPHRGTECTESGNGQYNNKRESAKLDRNPERVIASEYTQYELMATFAERPSSGSAVVKCIYGEGVAVLSGVHFEYDPTQLDSADPYLRDIIPKLLESDQARLACTTAVLETLGLQNLTWHELY